MKAGPTPSDATGSWRDVPRRHAQLLRFLLVGGLNTLFGMAVYGLAIVCRLPVWGALILGNAAGIVFNFLTTGGWVFRRLSWARFRRFVACYGLLYGLNLALVTGLRHWVPGAITAQALLTLPMALLSYGLLSRFVFRP
jgi:putative flippase GtrA